MAKKQRNKPMKPPTISDHSKDHIVEKNAVVGYKEGYGRYSIEVNRRRAIPDVRDGLKLVQRRNIDGMSDKKPVAKTQFVKCASIVGAVMDASHPHGDSSIYDALCGMANWFDNTVPLVEPHGTLGTIQGDDASAARYTECKLSQFCLEAVVGDLAKNKNVVEWLRTYNNRDYEPEYFPVKVPLLLINGCDGIGVGLICSVPKHNMNEVIDATLNLMDNPDAKVVLVPDHCQKCDIIESNWKEISNIGHGTYRARGIISITEDGNITVDTTPDGVTWNTVHDRLKSLVADGKLPQVVRIEEGADENKLDNLIVLKKGSDANYVREFIFKHTPMENTYTVNFEALMGTELLRFSYKSYLDLFIENSINIKFRFYCNILQEVKTEYHKKDAYVKALQSGYIETIQQKIRKMKTVDDNELIEWLIKTLKITDIQAEYIINARQKTLSEGYLRQYIQEANELLAQEKLIMGKLMDDNLLKEEIKQELIYFKNKYGRPRNCKVISKHSATDIPKGEFKIVLTEAGYIKKIGANEYATSFRGDNPKYVLKVENTQNILLFDNKGKVFKLPIHKVPVTEKNTLGYDIRILIKGLTASIISIMYEPVLKDIADKVAAPFVTVVTEGNYIKKLDIRDFLTVPPSGIIYTKLNADDCVKDIQIISDSLDVIVYSDFKALRIPMKEIPNYKRSTVGVFAMNTTDKIDGLSVIYPGTTDIVVLTKSGKINKFNVAGFKTSSRYKSGSSVINLSSNDSIFGIYGVNDDMVMKVHTQTGITEIPVKDVPSMSSVSAGKKLIPLKADSIAKCTIFKQS